MFSFIIDKITAIDVENRIVRISVVNKQYFPGLNIEIDTKYKIAVKIGDEIYDAIYTARKGRSGIIRLGPAIYVDKLRMQPYDRLLVKVLETDKLYEINKL